MDDQPSNNALLIASFRDSGIEVTTALTTADAAALLCDLLERFAAVISDQGRIEDGKLMETVLAGDALMGDTDG